jgi:hypothetical protein
VGAGWGCWANAGRNAIVTTKLSNTKKREKRFIQKLLEKVTESI